LKNDADRGYRVEMTEIPEAEKETAEAEEAEEEEVILATA
jgi:hypothetical protein